MLTLAYAWVRRLYDIIIFHSCYTLFFSRLALSFIYNFTGSFNVLHENRKRDVIMALKAVKVMTPLASKYFGDGLTLLAMQPTCKLFNDSNGANRLVTLGWTNQNPTFCWHSENDSLTVATAVRRLPLVQVSNEICYSMTFSFPRYLYMAPAAAILMMSQHCFCCKLDTPSYTQSNRDSSAV